MSKETWLDYTRRAWSTIADENKPQRFFFFFAQALCRFREANSEGSPVLGHVFRYFCLNS